MLGAHADADDARRDAAQHRKAVEQRRGPGRGDRLLGIEERVDDAAFALYVLMQTFIRLAAAGLPQPEN